jgi:hypothetical protein
MKRIRSLLSVCAAVAVCLAVVGGWASSASADLRLDVLSPTGGATMAVPTSSDGKWTVPDIQLWYTVTTGTNPTQNAVNRFYYSLYSTNITASGRDLTKININLPTYASSTWSTQPVYQFTGGGATGFEQVPFSYTGQPNGTGTTNPTQQDLDNDGDKDLGSTGSLVDNGTGTPPAHGVWGGIDANNKNYTPIDQNGDPTGAPNTLLPYWSSSPSMQFATASLSHVAYSAQPYGHGVTQVFLVGKPQTQIIDNDWKENGVEQTASSPVSGGKLTLYRTGTANNSSGSLVLTQTSGPVLLDGSTSDGSLDRWTWAVRKQGQATWHPVATANSGTSYLAYDDLFTLLGADYGLYDLKLVTTWVDPLNQVALPGDNAATSGISLLTYTPEPGTILLLAAGSAGMAIIRRRRKN